MSQSADRIRPAARRHIATLLSATLALLVVALVQPGVAFSSAGRSPWDSGTTIADLHGVASANAADG